MHEPTIPAEALETWADYLLDHSLGGITPDDRVMIKGERIGWPLMSILERKVIEAGAVPDVMLVPPNNERGRVWSATMGRHGNAGQVENVPRWHQARYEWFNKYVEVLGAEDPKLYGGMTPEQRSALVTADGPYSRLRLGKRWVITLFPTPGYAEMEGMDLDEYVDFIVKASTTDPVPLKLAEEQVAPLFDKGSEAVVVTHGKGRDLTLRIDLSPGHAEMSYGLCNFPDGEVFTSPDANHTEGEIFLDLPVHYGGEDMQGIYLRIEGGRIVEYSADQGMDQLSSIIETDDGSHRLGEFALGMNPGLDRVLKHPLFVEKVGGTLHIAIGASYEECQVADPGSPEGKEKVAELEAAGVLNRSAQHVDIVADFRPGGCGRSVHIDGHELVVRDNIWVPA